jgi:hypothetical protein
LHEKCSRFDEPLVRGGIDMIEKSAHCRALTMHSLLVVLRDVDKLDHRRRLPGLHALHWRWTQRFHFGSDVRVSAPGAEQKDLSFSAAELSAAPYSGSYQHPRLAPADDGDVQENCCHA